LRSLADGVQLVGYGSQLHNEASLAPTSPVKCLAHFIFHAPATTEIYTLSLHDALPICTSFSLTAQSAYLTQPDGQAIYSWGYGCSAGFMPTFAPATITTGFCNAMLVPAPTLIVTEGSTDTVTLTNNLPTSAGNTSILFPGFHVATSGGVTGS